MDHRQFSSTRSDVCVKVAMLSAVISGALLGCQQQAETTLPIGNYIDRRIGACELLVVTAGGLSRVPAKNCLDSATIAATYHAITMDIPTCGLVTFRAGSPGDRSTYGRTGGQVLGCNLAGSKQWEPGVAWIALR